MKCIIKATIFSIISLSMISFTRSDIRHVNVETEKMFYATAPDENGNFDPELPYEEENETDSNDDHDALPPVKKRHLE